MFWKTEVPISGLGRLGKKDIFCKSFGRFGNFMTKVKRYIYTAPGFQTERKKRGGQTMVDVMMVDKKENTKKKSLET